MCMCLWLLYAKWVSVYTYVCNDEMLLCASCLPQQQHAHSQTVLCAIIHPPSPPFPQLFAIHDGKKNKALPIPSCSRTLCVIAHFYIQYIFCVIYDSMQFDWDFLAIIFLSFLCPFSPSLWNRYTHTTYIYIFVYSTPNVEVVAICYRFYFFFFFAALLSPRRLFFTITDIAFWEYIFPWW